MPGKRRRHFIIQGSPGEQHVLSPRAKCSLTESINVMDSAHPIRAHFTILALPAGNDLLADWVVADCQSILFTGTLSKSDHFTCKFVSRGDGGLAIARSIFMT